MTQATALSEYPTANGAFRAARIAFVHALWHADIVREARAGFKTTAGREYPTAGLGAGRMEYRRTGPLNTIYRDDYATGGFKMLPVEDPKLSMTGRMIVVYTAALLPVSVLPSLLTPALTGHVYLVAATLLGIAFMWFGVSCAVYRTRLEARRLFFASIIYLPLLLGAMMLDKG